jgi:hypothetical protein
MIVELRTSEAMKLRQSIQLDAQGIFEVIGSEGSEGIPAAPLPSIHSAGMKCILRVEGKGLEVQRYLVRHALTAGGGKLAAFLSSKFKKFAMEDHCKAYREHVMDIDSIDFKQMKVRLDFVWFCVRFINGLQR